MANTVESVVLTPQAATAIADNFRPGNRTEQGWVLLGNLDVSPTIEQAIYDDSPQEKPNGFTFDYNAMAKRVSFAWKVDPFLEILGTVHSHPCGTPFPSNFDIRESVEWLKRSMRKIGIFGIAVPDDLTAHGGLKCKTGSCLFFVMDLEMLSWKPIKVTM